MEYAQAGMPAHYASAVICTIEAHSCQAWKQVIGCTADLHLSCRHVAEGNGSHEGLLLWRMVSADGMRVAVPWAAVAESLEYISHLAGRPGGVPAETQCSAGSS